MERSTPGRSGGFSSGDRRANRRENEPVATAGCWRTRRPLYFGAVATVCFRALNRRVVNSVSRRLHELGAESGRHR